MKVLSLPSVYDIVPVDPLPVIPFILTPEGRVIVFVRESDNVTVPTEPLEMILLIPTPLFPFVPISDGFGSNIVEK